MPGISPGRSRPSEGRRGVRGGLGTPPRSSLGARLRRRVPQYGHSVMYGDTSAPQFLQTTKRSGPLAMGPIDSTCGSGAGRFDDLGHDLAKVVVGLVDDDLTLGATALGQQILDAGEVVGGADLLGVLAQPAEQPMGQVLRGDAVAGRQVDELAPEPVTGGQPLVLVE